MVRKTVPVSAQIAPYSDLDTYATHDSVFGKGGIREVELLADRNTISDDRRREGMIVYVRSSKIWYVLHEGITNSDWKDLRDVLGINFGTANIIMSVTEPTENVTSQTVWIDPFLRVIKFRDPSNTFWIDFSGSGGSGESNNVIITHPEPTTGITNQTVWIDPYTKKLRYRNPLNTLWIEFAATSNVIVSTTEPDTPENQTLWVEPTTKKIQCRNATNTAWIDLIPESFCNVIVDDAEPTTFTAQTLWANPNMKEIKTRNKTNTAWIQYTGEGVDYEFTGGDLGTF